MLFCPRSHHLHAGVKNSLTAAFATPTTFNSLDQPCVNVILLQSGVCYCKLYSVSYFATGDTNILADLSAARSHGRRHALYLLIARIGQDWGF